MQSTDPLRNVNGQIPNETQGPLAAERWAEVLGVEVPRVLELFREAKVPRKRIGRRIYVHPRDLWGAFGYVEE